MDATGAEGSDVADDGDDRGGAVDGPAADGPAGPLAGVRIVEIAALGAAPYGVMLLADLGADVIRIDRPGAGSDPNTLAHVGVARGRRSVMLDLKQDKGRRVLDRLLVDADVLVEGFRPGVMERLGLGPDEVLARHPRLIYARMTGWGQDGPLARTAGHDINYAALSGALSTVGTEGTPPPPVVNYLADLGGGGMLLAVGVLAALHERSGSGRGQTIDVAMVDGAASLTSFVRGLAALGGWRAERGTNLLDGGAPFYATYPCADGRYVAVGALEPQFFAELATGLDLPADVTRTPYDREGWPALRDAIAERLLTRTRDEWAERFTGTDACVTPVLALSEVAADAQHRARGTFAAGLEGRLPPSARGWSMPAPAPRFGRTPGAVRCGAPLPGADTSEVLGAVGLTPDEIADLLESGAAAVAP